MEITKEQKSEYLRIYCELCRKGKINHSLIAMGNLAFFTDRCLLLPKARTLKKEFLSLSASNRPSDFQDLCLLIARNIHQMAKRDQIGENLDFRLKRIESKHESKKLDHFDMLLDEHDFPLWFQVYIPFIEAEDEDVLYRLFMNMIQLNEEFQRQGKFDAVDAKLTIFLKRVKEHKQKWLLMLLLVDAVLEEQYSNVMSLFDCKVP